MWNLFYKWNSFKSMLRDQKGQGMVEYALILGLVVVGAIVAFRTMGNNVFTMANDVATNMHK